MACVSAVAVAVSMASVDMPLLHLLLSRHGDPNVCMEVRVWDSGPRLRWRLTCGGWQNGMRPLHMCCMRGLHAPTELLLEYAADHAVRCDVRGVPRHAV